MSNPLIEQRKAWARQFVAAGKGSPMYGTPEWAALPDGPAKVASCVRAAECWATEGDEYAERVTLELEQAALVAKRLEDEAFVARGQEHAQRWRGGVYHPTAQDDAAIAQDWTDWVGGDVA